MNLIFDGSALPTGNMSLSTRTNADGTFTVRTDAPAEVKEGWTVQAHFKGLKIRPVDDLSPFYNSSDSIIQTFSTVESSVNPTPGKGDNGGGGGAVDLPIIPLTCEDGSTPDELGQCPSTDPILCDDGSTPNEITGECPSTDPILCDDGSTPDEITGECPAPIELVTCENGTAPNEQGQCEPIPLTPDCTDGTSANEFGECAPLVAPTENECPDGTAPDDLGQCVPV
jgi:hypothetical protein